MSDDTATHFREMEILRRKARREYLLKCVANEGTLLSEELSSEQAQAHRQAVANILKQDLIFEKECTPGYWQRLWAAIWGH